MEAATFANSIMRPRPAGADLKTAGRVWPNPHVEEHDRADPHAKGTPEERAPSLTDGPGCRYVPPSASEASCRLIDATYPPIEQRQKAIEPNQRQLSPAPTPRRSFGNRPAPASFFVSADGHLITNAHIIDSCRTINGIDGITGKFPLTVVRVMQSEDLALLKARKAPKSFA